MMQELDEIAIVGVGCKFPGARNLKEYWRVLSNGENHVKEVPRDRWNIDAYYDPDPNAPGKMYVRTAGFVDGIDEWDHRFYGINDMEAELVDPQQRMVLDCVHMAFEDAGITRKDVEGSNTGVYIGCMTDDYKGHVLDDTTVSSTYSVTGTHNSIISARVSYVYNLTGPAMTLDTACSSSLVAIKIASEALLLDTCDIAICGGVNVLLDPQLFIALSKARMLSPDGQCKTFTAEANGYARGEGCGIVVLKKVSKALQDGNKIWATITAGSNQDGRNASPITAPSGQQQEKLMETMYRKHDIDRSIISVIEAHGTGTAIGDPTEVKALGNHFGTVSGARDIFIGSVKTNIGHLEAAAGVAGLIKVLLMMKHDTIVPSLWYTKANENPKLSLSKHGFNVPTTCTPWIKTNGLERVACVNSFGFGGTNAHAIVKEFVNVDRNNHGEQTAIPYFVAVSALDAVSLRDNIRHLAENLKSTKYNIASLSCTSTCRRDHHPFRKVFQVHSQGDLVTKCENVLSRKEETPTATAKNKIVFVFCGVGTTWRGMCKSLLDIEIFHNTIREIDGHLELLTGWSIEETFANSSDINTDPVVSHIAIFCCQVGLATLWKGLGVTPEAVVGQSVGEVAAAYIAGYVDLKTAVHIIYFRSIALSSVKRGTMAVVRNIPTETVKKYCATSNEKVCVAVINSPVSCTISGDEDAIHNLTKRLDSIPDTTPVITKLDVGCAYHSPLVVDAANQLKAKLEHIQSKRGVIPMCSSVTGKSETNGLLSTAEYWEKNVKYPVLFDDAVRNSTTHKGHNIFLEIGPHPVLRAHVKNILPNETKYTVLPSMKKEDDMNTLADSICKLFEVGANITWELLLPCRGLPTEIPTYQRRRHQKLFRSDNALTRTQKLETSSVAHPYIKRVPATSEHSQFKMEVDQETTWFVYQHEVNGTVILPGACYADIGFEIGKLAKKTKDQSAVSVEFLRPVKIEDSRKTLLQISTVKQEEEVLFHVKHQNVVTCKGWVKQVSSERVRRGSIDLESLRMSVSSAKTETFESEDIYRRLQSLGFKHGKCFRLMLNAVTNGKESLSEMNVPNNILTEADSTVLHPCILDVMMQSTINTTNEDLMSTIQKEQLTFLPVAINEIYSYRKPEEKMIIYTKRINTTILETVFQAHYNALLLTQDGLPVAEIVNYCTFSRRHGHAAPCELSYELHWHKLQGYAKDSNLACPKVLLMANAEYQKTSLAFETFRNIIVSRQNRDCDTYRTYVRESFDIARQRWGSIKHADAIVLLIQENFVEHITTKEGASDQYQLIKGNCLLLTELVKFKTKSAIPTPLYVVTQNTQPALPIQKARHNMIGAELWGFVRSLHLEFIHGDITMVDLQPNLEETRNSLVNFIAASLHRLSTTVPDIIIQYDNILGAQLNKVKRSELTPSLRRETRPAGSFASPCDVITKQSSGRGDKHLCISEPDRRESDKVFHVIRVSEVALHPSDIFPRTTSELKSEQDIWQDSLTDGHSVIGVEYTGYPRSTSKKWGPVCKTGVSQNDIEGMEDMWKVVAFYPTQIRTETSVPKECIIHLKDLPFYKPGLITYAMVFWKFVEHVPFRQNVFVCKGRSKALPYAILEEMLKSLKHSSIINPEDIDQTPVDLVLTLTKFEESFELLWKCSTIVCLQNNFQESTGTTLARTNKHTIIKITTEQLFDRKYISKVLPKVVSWLQRHSKFVETCMSQHVSRAAVRSFETSDDITFPCNVIQLYKDCRLNIPLRHSLSSLFSRQGCYIVTGGTTGLGWETVKLLAEMGAGVVAPMSRRAVARDKAEEANSLSKSTGSSIVFLQCDVNDFKSVTNALQTLQVKAPQFTLKGVFHCAGVLQDKLLMNMDETILENVLKPKVLGTLNMHVATRANNLDYFVVSSSINRFVGSPGQSNYGAANSFQDACMEWRRRSGLPGQAIDWGALSVGMAARSVFIDNFAKRGYSLMTVTEIRSCYQEILLRNTTSVVYSDINWDAAAKDYLNPHMVRPRIRMELLLDESVSKITSDENGNEAADISFDVQSLKNSDTETQMVSLVGLLTLVAGKVIGGPVGQISKTSTLSEMSFDSMSTVTFINVIQEMTGYRIPPRFMLDTGRTISDMADLLQEKLFVTVHKEDTRKKE
ncbi:phenolphthiocerol/phthiocerol polyketide synthase subunit C-like [Mercenaria mercenaria]|uniref:phenolphthiocerol/phthiocerol polyketide synthase subunit C-like n=1 Tax=Mercenaria mercenaria TaxID=6596 RepID=UPI00234ED557|nr:phenolphthiocerol/phthiocerol polyketide synthase subunit C-like [Mercenaria mercenaria]